MEQSGVMALKKSIGDIIVVFIPIIEDTKININIIGPYIITGCLLWTTIDFNKLPLSQEWKLYGNLGWNIRKRTKEYNKQQL